MLSRVTEGGRTFSVTTCQLWNSLSLELRNLVPLESFKNNYRNILVKSNRNYTILQFDHILAYIFHYPYHYLLNSFIYIDLCQICRTSIFPLFLINFVLRLCIYGILLLL